MIDKNGEGVLGFITNHGYLDNPTFRGMRQHLLNTFDKIWVLDLHGNSKKKEVAPDGSPDTNVFDIQQGVAIIIASKKKHLGVPDKNPPASVYHGELWGTRKEKYETLLNNNYTQACKDTLEPRHRYFMFYNVNTESLGVYDLGFPVEELFPVQSTGIISARDNLTIDFDRDTLAAKLRYFLSSEKTDDEVRRHFFGQKKTGKYLPGDSRGWRLSEKRPVLQTKIIENYIKNIVYRPFDIRSIIYDPDIVDWPRLETMKDFNKGKNISLLTPRMTSDDFSPFVSSEIISNKTASRYDQTYFFPLYTYPADGDFDQSRRVNMDPKIRRKIEEAATGDDGEAPDEVAIFDYIYGVLHCPAYRATYREFLRIDFPRIPYPPSPEVFRDVAEKGGQLRRLHLMENEAVGETPYPFTGEGDSVVGKVEYKAGAVFINDTQCFENVPKIAWDFYIGGYQPAQKWLKDRKGRTLSFDDILHYRKIVKILSETDRIMKTIKMPLGTE